jgi:hypothetical protein
LVSIEVRTNIVVDFFRWLTSKLNVADEMDEDDQVQSFEIDGDRMEVSRLS